MEAADGDRQHQIQVDRVVQESLSAGVRGFADLCRAAEGAFPTVVADAIRRVETPQAIHSISLWPDELGDLARGHEAWPEPSPFDYEWRFTPDSADYLANYASKIGEPVACIGAPTVFASLSAKGVRAILVDRNRAITMMLGARTKNPVVCADVAMLPEVLERRRFPVVVMDPPWYPDHYRHWLRHSAAIAETRGVILSTMFPRLTRPAAETERADLMRELGRVGPLSAIGRISYETPLFERETLVSNGLPPLASWRSAEILRLTLDMGIPDSVAPAPPEPEWWRFILGTQTVGLRVAAPEDEDEIRVTALNDDGSFLLRSVSARDPVRSQIDLWTSRNRAAKIQGRVRAARFLEAVTSGCSPQEAVGTIARSEMESVSLTLLLALLGR